MAIFKSIARPSLPLLLLSIGAAALVAGLGVLVSESPILGLLAGLAPILIVLLTRFPAARLAWFILGALAVFQLADSANALKLIYLGGVLLCAAVSLGSILRSPPPWLKSLAILGWSMMFFFFALATGLAIGLASHESSAVVRDILPYVLLLLAPLIGIDAGRVLKLRSLYVLTEFFGVLSSVGFATDWLDRRGVSALPFGRFLLATIAFGGLAMYVAALMAAQSRGITRIAHLLVVGLIPLGYLITGTRTSLVLLVGLVLLIGRQSQGKIAFSQLVGGGLLLAGIGIVVVPGIVQFAISDPTFLVARAQMLSKVLFGAAQADQSFQAREIAYQYGAQVWLSSPALGVGPGVIFQSGGSTLDSPLTVLAKFGVFGAMTSYGLVIAIAWIAIRQRRAGHRQAATSAAIAFILFAVACIPFGGLLEDKGFALAVAMCVAMLVANARGGPGDQSNAPRTAEAFVAEVA